MDSRPSFETWNTNAYSESIESFGKIHIAVEWNTLGVREIDKNWKNPWHCILINVNWQIYILLNGKIM